MDKNDQIPITNLHQSRLPRSESISSRSLIPGPADPMRGCSTSFVIPSLVLARGGPLEVESQHVAAEACDEVVRFGKVGRVCYFGRMGEGAVVEVGSVVGGGAFG